jgi:hypothetical protein
MDLLASTSIFFVLLQYYAESHALIYIVDSSDRDRIPDSKEAFGMHFLFYIYCALSHGDMLFQLVMHAKMSVIKIFLTAITFRLAPDFLLPHFLKCFLHCIQGTVSWALK